MADLEGRQGSSGSEAGRQCKLGRQAGQIRPTSRADQARKQAGREQEVVRQVLQSKQADTNAFRQGRQTFRQVRAGMNGRRGRAGRHAGQIKLANKQAAGNLFSAGRQGTADQTGEGR
jgi:hypothetical protein